MIPESRTTRRGRLAGTLGAFPGVLTAAAALVALSALAGCSSYDSVTQRIAQSITPYRITIVQGNFVSAEAAAQMRVGMTRAEVTQLLGTPLLADMFHPERWDYLFYFKRGSKSIVQQRDFVVNFDGDSVTSWSGGENLPSNLELLAEIDGDRTGKKVNTAKAAPNTGTVVSAEAASAAAAGPTVPDTTRSTSPELGAATAALPQEPNAVAASAANRALNEAPPPSNAPAPASNTAPQASSGLLGNVSSPPQQLQLRQPTPPAPNAPDNAPVGPTVNSPGTGTLGGGGPAPQSAPLAAPPNLVGAGGEENGAPPPAQNEPPPPAAPGASGPGGDGNNGNGAPAPAQNGPAAAPPPADAPVAAPGSDGGAPPPQDEPSASSDAVGTAPGAGGNGGDDGAPPQGDPAATAPAPGAN